MTPDLPLTIGPRPSTNLYFIGHIAVKEDHILVVGPAGEVRIEGSSAELHAVQNLIDRLDGCVQLGSLMPGDTKAQRQQEAVLAALNKVGALLDYADAWCWYHELSSNPPIAPPRLDPMTAYSLPRLDVHGTPLSRELGRLDQTSVDVLACDRRSADLRSAAATPAASFRSAMRLAVNSYLPRRDGRRPVASGGALYPLHFWVVGSDKAAAPRQILGVDHDHGTTRSCGEIGLSELQELFVPDPDVTTALARGAAVIIIAADPRRITRKYGNRGWRFALMECGAVMHHVMLAATARKEAVRPIGGYFDRLVQRAICDPALPLLTILVMAEQ
jgi:hypothetical protein